MFNSEDYIGDGLFKETTVYLDLATWDEGYVKGLEVRNLKALNNIDNVIEVINIVFSDVTDIHRIFKVMEESEYFSWNDFSGKSDHVTKLMVCEMLYYTDHFDPIFDVDGLQSELIQLNPIGDKYVDGEPIHTFLIDTNFDDIESYVFEKYKISYVELKEEPQDDPRQLSLF